MVSIIGLMEREGMGWNAFLNEG